MSYALNSNRNEMLKLLWPWLPLWMLVAVVTIFQHGPMPMYSTRVLSVAWEMWHRHDFLVPYLNGTPYSDKPPLLFWLIQLGWAIGGVGDVWPRCLEVICGAVQLVLAATLASRLFPDRPVAARNMPWVLLAFSYSFLFGLQVMYEVLLAACVLGALVALMPRQHDPSPRFGWFAFAVSLGLLTKGPVMLLHVGIPWLLGPLWNEWARRERVRWYVQGSIASLASLGVLLLWALSAARAGGAAYREQLLFHQTAGRVVDAFAHALPFWWYMPIIPALIFPFCLWPRVWVAILKLRVNDEWGLRFLLAWLFPVVVIFSLISGKQPYYLLPECAGFAMLIAIAIARLNLEQSEIKFGALLWPWPLTLTVVALGVTLLALPTLVNDQWVHDARINPLTSYSREFGVLFCALGLLVLPGKYELQRVAVLGLLGTAAGSLFFGMTLWPTFDFAPAAVILAKAEAKHEPIANLETYDGQFHFLGRLTQPIAHLATNEAISRWCIEHQDGLLVGYKPELSATQRADAIYAQRFRGVYLVIWPTSSCQSALNVSFPKTHYRKAPTPTDSAHFSRALATI